MDTPDMVPSAIPSARAPRQAAFGFIFASALMNSISFGLMIPILPNLIKQFTGGDTAAASEWNVLFATTWGLMQFVFGPILGKVAYFPVKMKFRVLDPVYFDVEPGLERYSKSRVMDEAESIRVKLQDNLYDMLRDRRSVWFG